MDVENRTDPQGNGPTHTNRDGGNGAAGGGAAELHLLGQRKHVVAREVQSAALSPLDAGALNAALVASPPARREVGPPPEVLLDPTLDLGQRRRKHSHERLYRLTFAAIVASFAATIGSVVGVVLEQPRHARMAAVAAAATGIGSILLTGMTRLNNRLRGNAVAAAILGVLAIGANLTLLAPRSPGRPVTTRPAVTQPLLPPPSR